jgi:hypothetical protein
VLHIASNMLRHQLLDYAAKAVAAIRLEYRRQTLSRPLLCRSDPASQKGAARLETDAALSLLPERRLHRREGQPIRKRQPRPLGTAVVIYTDPEGRHIYIAAADDPDAAETSLRAR